MTVDPVRPASQQDSELKAALVEAQVASHHRPGEPGGFEKLQAANAALFAAIDAYVERRVKQAIEEQMVARREAFKAQFARPQR